MRELYFSRHGITDDLENGIRNRFDAKLTPVGHEEARATGEQLLARFIIPQLVVCSRLPRAIQTAENIAEVIGYDKEDIVQSDLLNERDCGIAKGMKNAEIRRLYPGGFDTVPNAESTEAAQERAAYAAEWLESLPEDVVLVVGYGVSVRGIARHYMNLPYTEEFNPEVREVTNLRNGQIMQLVPGPVQLLPLEKT